METPALYENEDETAQVFEFVFAPIAFGKTHAPSRHKAAVPQKPSCTDAHRERR